LIVTVVAATTAAAAAAAAGDDDGAVIHCSLRVNRITVAYMRHSQQPL